MQAYSQKLMPAFYTDEIFCYYQLINRFCPLAQRLHSRFHLSWMHFWAQPGSFLPRNDHRSYNIRMY